jgi:uncharacterized protein YneR
MMKNKEWIKEEIDMEMTNRMRFYCGVSKNLYFPCQVLKERFL